MPPSHYTVLNITKKATKKEIKIAYRNLAKKYHPDVNTSRASQAMFTKIQSAYEVLKDDRKRREYDKDLAGGNAGSRTGGSDWTNSANHSSTRWKGRYDAPGREGSGSATNPDDYLGRRRNINEEFIEKLKRKERFYKAYGSGKYRYEAQENYDPGNDPKKKTGFYAEDIPPI